MGFFGFPARGGDRDVLLNVSLLSLSQHLTRSMDMASSLRSYESRKKSFRMNRQKSLFEFLELFIVVVAAVLFLHFRSPNFRDFRRVHRDLRRRKGLRRWQRLRLRRRVTRGSVVSRLQK